MKEYDLFPLESLSIDVNGESVAVTILPPDDPSCGRVRLGLTIADGVPVRHHQAPARATRRQLVHLTTRSR